MELPLRSQEWNSRSAPRPEGWSRRPPLRTRLVAVADSDVVGPPAGDLERVRPRHERQRRDAIARELVAAHPHLPVEDMHHQLRPALVRRRRGEERRRRRDADALGGDKLTDCGVPE